MLKKRLIGVIAVKDDWAVQSFGYRRYLPLGRPECLAENLDRWGADEILLLDIDRSRRGEGPDLRLLRRVGGLGLSTPLTYGGGIRTVEHAAAVIQAGAERLCVDQALYHDHASIRAMAELVGAQALIASLPLRIQEQQLRWYDYMTGRSRALTDDVLALLADEVISECLVIDCVNEGQPCAFDMRLVESFPLASVPLIAFGGLSEATQLAAVLALPHVVAAGVGNFLSYSEHAIQTLKRQLVNMPVRPAVYAADY